MNVERRRFRARSGEQRSRQFRIRLDDASHGVGDLDVLREP
jgi:hypothetical protein